MHRALITGALVVCAVAGAVAPAAARTPLEGYLAQRGSVNRAIASLREQRVETGDAMTRRAISATRRLRRLSGPGAAANPRRFRHLQRRLLQERRDALRRIERSVRHVARRVDALQTRRSSIDTWLDTWGIFEVCPIRGWHAISDNFGITVRLPDVPVHRHEGNDILAHMGTPIVAPFDGVATSSQSELGGLEVRVTGARGYVYNAHLSSLGTLGQVRAGTVIGYVGDTGDATTAHDHLEWHPGGGVAVDPYPYLSASCDGT
jgi:murein DD-endopeptidase MepM/ murein hydrolase activator NlpD